MIDSDLQKTISFIKDKHKIFLEKKIKEKEAQILKNSYLDLAKSKKDLKYLLLAREIALQAQEKRKDEDEDFELDEELLDFFTRSIFEKLKPVELKEPKFIIQDNIHKGNYHSRDIHEMIAGKITNRNGSVYHRCWEVLENEYVNMNIDCNSDSGENYRDFEFENLRNVYQALRLSDIIS
ncbi:hypothetical protein OAM15_04155 [Pelagibacteraceae bacterium]|nr:hypothetical protein [Pelagibacteraceae bacterium]